MVIGIFGPSIRISGGRVSAPAVGDGAVYESKTESTTATFTKPSGTVDGDLLLYLGHANLGGSVTLPSGWTSLWTGQASASYGPYGVLGHTLAWKLASSEPASWTFTNSVRGALWRYSGCSLVTPVDGVQVGGEVDEVLTLDTPDLTTTVANTRILHLLAGSMDDHVVWSPDPPSGTVERTLYRDVSNRNMVVLLERTAIQSAAGPTGQTTLAQSGNRRYKYTYPITLAIRPTGT